MASASQEEAVQLLVLPVDTAVQELLDPADTVALVVSEVSAAVLRRVSSAPAHLAAVKSNPMNETLYSDINSSISGIAAVEPILQVSEGTKPNSFVQWPFIHSHGATIHHRRCTINFKLGRQLPDLANRHSFWNKPAGGRNRRCLTERKQLSILRSWCRRHSKHSWNKLQCSRHLQPHRS